MNREKRDLSILGKMIRRCDEISETIRFFGDSYERLENNSIYKNAAAMPLLQIGELAGHLSEGFRAAHPEMPWLRMKAMRNVAAHDYESFSLRTMWGTMKEDIPALREYCQRIIEENADE